MKKIALADDIDKMPEKDLTFDFDNMIYNEGCVYVRTPFKFSNVALVNLRKTVDELPPMDRKYNVRLGESLDSLPLKELYQVILLMDQRVRLMLNISQGLINEMGTKEDKANHKSIKIESTASRLVTTCLLAGHDRYMLASFLMTMNPSLIVHLNEYIRKKNNDPEEVEKTMLVMDLLSMVPRKKAEK
jgi:hypothetical protein